VLNIIQSDLDFHISLYKESIHALKFDIRPAEQQLVTLNAFQCAFLAKAYSCVFILLVSQLGHKLRHKLNK